MEGDYLQSEVEFANKQVISNAWMCRPCEWYWDEYKECKRIGARLHQYFIYGRYKDCTPWKIDYENCMDFRRHNNLESLQKVIESEERKIERRKKATYANDTWEFRDSPPTEMWNLRLPEWLSKRYKGSLLEYYQKTHSGSNK